MKGSLALAPSTEELLLLSFSFSARVTRKGGTSRRLQGEQPLTVEATRAFENLLLLLLRWCWWCSCHNSCVISVCLCGIIYCDPSGGWKKKKQYLFIIKNRRESGKIPFGGHLSLQRVFTSQTPGDRERKGLQYREPSLRK